MSESQDLRLKEMISKIMLALTMWASFCCSQTEAWSDGITKTIVFMRHAEKPEGGLGQLNCRGLNRALALPSLIAKTFGKPDIIMAPIPSIKEDRGTPYYYVRPLATIEPTAIEFGLPVDVGLDFSDLRGLVAALQRPISRSTLIIVVWEHNVIGDAARLLLKAQSGNWTDVPNEWPYDDFDSMYVVKIDARGSTFSHQQERLDQQSEVCPGFDHP
jgi:hypothetical protein